MAYISTITLKEGKKFEGFYKTPKDVSKLSDKQIKNYLASYGEIDNNTRHDFNIPEMIASPIRQPKKGLEFKSGYTGDIMYHGVINNMREFNDEEAFNFVGDWRNGAYFEKREINIDTYFNKVLTEAWTRGIVKLQRKINSISLCEKKVKFKEPMETIFLNDLYSLRLSRAFTRDSVQNREYKEQIRKLYEWQKASEEHMKHDTTQWNCAIA